MKLKNILLIGSIFLFTGCSTVSNYSNFNKIPADGTITVLPFKNNTNSPQAGEKAKNIMEGVLASKNRSVQISSANQRDNISCNANSNAISTRYYLSGNINEWRYKTGIEAEPAVAINFNVIDRLNCEVVYSAVGAKNGWGQESVGSVAQKLILELTSN